MGCHRSGTNLLYDMLLSSGGFAIYRGFLPIYKILIPRFGSMESGANRAKILDIWLRSKGFRRTGLDAEQLSERIMNGCRNGGDFIRAVMDSVAESQQMPRWAVYDPDNVLHVERVKRDIPNALFVHIIRDGRDIALSLKKMGGFTPLPWDRGQTDSLVATALYWEWMIYQGRKHGSQFPADYIEVRYEDLITSSENAEQARWLSRSRPRLRQNSTRRVRPIVGNKFFVPRRRNEREAQSTGTVERAPGARRCRGDRIQCGPLPSRKWLRIVATRD